MNGKAPLKSDWYQARNLLKMLSFMKICLVYENIEIFIQVHQTVQHLLGKITVSRPSLENPENLFIFLKFVHFGKIYNFPYDHSEASCLLKMLILFQICSFYQWNDSQLILFQSGKNLFIFFEIVQK